MPAPENQFHRAILGGVLGFVIVASWPGVHASLFMLAAAIYFALPKAHRTRSNASLVGWSVGFAVVLLSWSLRSL